VADRRTRLVAATTALRAAVQEQVSGGGDVVVVAAEPVSHKRHDQLVAMQVVHHPLGPPVVRA